MRADLGVSESGLQRVVRGAYDLLDLLAFFTAGEGKPAQSWHMRRGQTAWHAAGEIHSDIQRGFVRAEVIGWDALVEAGGYAGGRDRGTLRLEGRDYVMQDGDVITVKFTP
jgi:ribosome-binding ATPase YchF (GTP1/OBG family)